MFIKNLVFWLKKQSCLICGQIHHEAICLDCQQFLPSLPQSCMQCAQILPSDASSEICFACQYEPPPFTHTFALFPYAFPIGQFIHRLKFQGQLVYAALFADLMLKAIREHWYQQRALPDQIIPMPLHPKRLQERGFNQALEIARPLARALKRPLDYHCAQRIRATVPQSSLSAKERGANIANAFAIQKNYADAHIAVVDDVVTTGQTIRAFCQELKQHGAKTIDVWCCAKRIL